MTYLTPLQIAVILRDVSYKPGFMFSTFTHPVEGFCLTIEFTVPNSYRQGERQTQRVNVPVPPIVSAEHFHDWLNWRLDRIDDHERVEFYKVSGEMRCDPHSESYWELGRQKKEQTEPVVHREFGPCECLWCASKKVLSSTHDLGPNSCQCVMCANDRKAKK